MGTEGRCRAFQVMQQKIPTLERAFQLARNRSCRTIEELRKALRHEGYSTEQITGRALSKQLRELMTRDDEKAPGPRPLK